MPLFFRIFVRFFCISLSLIWFTWPVSAENENIQIKFDLSAAEAVLTLFDAEQVSMDDVEALLELPAVQATIKQASRFDKNANQENYVTSLYAILNGQSPDIDPFDFGYVKEKITDIRKGLQQIKANIGEITNRLNSHLAAYIPRDFTAQTNLYAVLGGTSDGWAPGNDSFYVALDYFRNDATGFEAMLSHEVYHTLQGLFFGPVGKEQAGDKSTFLLSNLFLEGTATLVGNPMNFEGDGSYLKFLQDKHTRNMARIEQNFALFEALYFRIANDPQAPWGPIYNIGFSGTWDSPLYFVGFHIVEGLERHLGRERLVQMLSTLSGQEILTEYIRVYTETGDASLVTFSPTLEALIR